MIDILLTFLLIILLVVGLFWKAKPRVNGEGFFDKDYTNTLKGISSIVVIFVHIYGPYRNPVQDAVGNFAFACVTGFFVISSFGMQYSLDYNPKYLASFPVNRLTSLLIPNVVTNIVCWSMYYLVGAEYDLSILWMINWYTLTLLEYCLLFYVVNLLAAKFRWKHHFGDMILIAYVVGSSLYLYLTMDKGPFIWWSIERMGLVWGLLLYRHYNVVLQWFNRGFKAKIIAILFACIGLGLLFMYYKQVPFIRDYLLKIVLAGAIILFYIAVNHKIKLVNGFTKMLGAISYETFLIHFSVLYAVYLTNSTLSSGIYIWSVIVITLTLSYISHLIDAPIVGAAKTLFRRIHR